jgi:hypothetical protein
VTAANAPQAQIKTGYYAMPAQGFNRIIGTSWIEPAAGGKVAGNGLIAANQCYEKIFHRNPKSESLNPKQSTKF